MNERIEPKAGTYALIMQCSDEKTVRVGRLGLLLLRPGLYVYVGSAFGPGGVRARVGRHLSGSCRIHWHIDYVLPKVRVTEVWFTYDSVKREEKWARVLTAMPETTIPLKGFGASDCRCESHFFRLSSGSGAGLEQVFSLLNEAESDYPIQRLPL